MRSCVRRRSCREGPSPVWLPCSSSLLRGVASNSIAASTLERSGRLSALIPVLPESLDLARPRGSRPYPVAELAQRLVRRTPAKERLLPERRSRGVRSRGARRPHSSVSRSTTWRVLAGIRLTPADAWDELREHGVGDRRELLGLAKERRGRPRRECRFPCSAALSRRAAGREAGSDRTAAVAPGTHGHVGPDQCFRSSSRPTSAIGLATTCQALAGLPLGLSFTTVVVAASTAWPLTARDRQLCAPYNHRLLTDDRRLRAAPPQRANTSPRRGTSGCFGSHVLEQSSAAERPRLAMAAGRRRQSSPQNGYYVSPAGVMPA
jgi:hypothetical protein